MATDILTEYSEAIQRMKTAEKNLRTFFEVGKRMLAMFGQAEVRPNYKEEKLAWLKMTAENDAAQKLVFKEGVRQPAQPTLRTISEMEWPSFADFWQSREDWIQARNDAFTIWKKIPDTQKQVVKLQDPDAI